MPLCLRNSVSKSTSWKLMWLNEGLILKGSAWLFSNKVVGVTGRYSLQTQAWWINFKRNLWTSTSYGIISPGLSVSWFQCENLNRVQPGPPSASASKQEPAAQWEIVTIINYPICGVSTATLSSPMAATTSSVEPVVHLPCWSPWLAINVKDHVAVTHLEWWVHSSSI